MENIIGCQYPWQFFARTGNLYFNQKYHDGTYERDVNILRYYGVTFTTRDWLKTCHDNAILKWVPQLRFNITGPVQNFTTMNRRLSLNYWHLHSSDNFYCTVDHLHELFNVKGALCMYVVTLNM